MEPTRHWQPGCERPAGLVRPVRRDPTGVSGPTRGQARGSRWRSTSYGWYVPTDTNAGSVEQRILEQSVKATGYGAISGWASLRWQGARYFTGEEFGEVLPVPILRAHGGHFEREGDSRISREQLRPSELMTAADVTCTIPARAAFDEMRRCGDLRSAVVALDMTLAAGLLCLGEYAEYVAHMQAWTGVPRVREALSLACADSRSPQESRMRLIWVLDAGLPPPLINRPVFDRTGKLLGLPDLLDAVSGVVGEYDGVDHKDAERHRRDVAREQRYREHGLEYFSLVGGDMRNRGLCVDRMLAARRRARRTPKSARRWTTEVPEWWRLRQPTDSR